MTLLNAPVYDEQKEKSKKSLLIAIAAAFVLLVILALAGFFLGHGWLFTNLPAEHKVSHFFSALEEKNYDKAFGIYTNDPDWKQHPDKHADYPISRFTEDWTTESPAGGPILSHHVDISKVAGSGTFGKGIIVATTVTAEGRAGEKKIFLYYQKSDGTMSLSPLNLEY